MRTCSLIGVLILVPFMVSFAEGPDVLPAARRGEPEAQVYALSEALLAELPLVLGGTVAAPLPDLVEPRLPLPAKPAALRTAPETVPASGLPVPAVPPLGRPAATPFTTPAAATAASSAPAPAKTAVPAASPAQQQASPAKPQVVPKTPAAEAKAPSAVPAKPVTATPAPAKPVAAAPAPAKSVTASPAATKPAQPAVAATGKGSPAARLSYVDPVSIATPVPTSAAVVPTGEVSHERQKQTAALGQQFSVTLPGTGWLYVGTGRSGDGVVFLQSNQQGTQTRFTFRLDKAGVPVLQFQRQDGQRAALERRELELTIGNGSEGSSNSVVLEAAAPVQVAPVAFRVTEVPADPEAKLLLAQKKERDGLASEALLVYEKLIADHPGWDRFDQALYQAASLLEKSSDKSKLRTAYAYYQKIQKDYPYSDYVDESRQRMRYLDRNYFNVR